MRLKVMAIILATVCVSSAFAQESDNKQINKIKRNSLYISAEATDVTEEKAQIEAEKMLNYYIDEYVASKKSLGKAEHVVVKDLKSKTDQLTMNRGTRVRVFLYVKKSDIIPADNVIVKETTQPEETAPNAIVDPIVEDNHISVSELPQWQQEMITELQSLSTMTEVRSKLNRLKSEYKIKRYGTTAPSRNPSYTFWIVNTQEYGMTVFGPGDPDRINYRTMQTDRLSFYSGRDAIWFEMAK